ncbi:MAG TPA: GNAT family N-acetyltransferase [Streptosporangiaceae bacterium]|nr:GNAT family N-acetyltransferase [Streptosporangiaceae bacterium]
MRSIQMVYDYRYMAVAARHRQMLAGAEDSRRAGPGRSRRPRPGRRSARRSADHGLPAVLRDGSQVLIRPVGPADVPVLADGFARLSARSRQLRFLGPKKQLTPAELRYLTEIDHHDHEALGAVDPASGLGVGVARYVRSFEDAQAAEIAVTVVDEWQRRGLGTELLAQLAQRARAEGIRRFTALVGADNVAMTALVRTTGAALVRREAATLVYEIPLLRQEGPS